MSRALDQSLLTAPSSLPAISGLALTVISDGTLVRHPLPAHGELVLGRDPACDIRIDDPTISRRHAAIAIDRSMVTIRDLGSRNGVAVGASMISREPVTFALDTIARIGAVSIVVQRARPQPAVGMSPSPMERVRELLDRVAAGSISVLILGETGVGKEVLADAIHRRSGRSGAPFLRLNCAALSETLLESELFGHEKGAFTGATQTKLGLLETAQGGTVFLDEIGELPLATQVRLLRVIEQREVMRVGGLAPRPIDVRFVAATHRDLLAEIAAGRFRQDLYFRLNGITLTIPPLRDRKVELDALTSLFLDRSATLAGCPRPTLTPRARAVLHDHSWPGNIRELRNVIERALVLAGGGPIDVEHLVLEPPARDSRPLAIVPESAAPPAPLPVVEGLPALRAQTAAAEREQIVAALARAAGNQKVAAQLLGVSRRALLNKLDGHGIARPRKRVAV